MSSRHQFHLRWSNYGHNLANSFLKLYESESLADVTLFCEGESYRAHRVVLAASSAHFQELFEQCATAQTLVVILDGTSAANLRALLEFMYKGEVYVDDANLNTFLETAKRLQVKGLSLSQNDLHNISSDVVEERSDGSKLPTFTSSAGSMHQDNLLAQSVGPLVLPPQQQTPTSQTQQQQQQPQLGKPINSVQTPPNCFSSPSPSQTPTHLHAKKKIRISPPRHQNAQSPDRDSGDNVDFGGHHPPQPPPRPVAPVPSPIVNRMMDMEQSGGRQAMIQGFPAFSPMYPPSSNQQQPMNPPVTHAQPPQQQTLVIAENPNLRKLRSVSTENTMPEDLSVKVEMGRDEELPGSISGKQRSFSMDLSPSEPPLGGMGSGPGPSNAWSLPSPSMSAQHSQQHDLTINAQSTADGKKLKCPFCERLYGYETNLRAHIRQRHQGIRVPCPFCTRTFTRNNTVRRHVAREHRALLGGVRAFQHPMTPDGGPGGVPPPGSFGSPPRSSPNSSPVQNNSPTSTNTNTSSSGGNNGIHMGSSSHMSSQNPTSHLAVSSSGPLSVHGSGSGMSSMQNMSTVAAAVAAAAANSSLSLGPQSPTGGGSGNNHRPSSRSSSVGKSLD